MASLLHEIEERAQALSREEKAALISTLIDQLETKADTDADALWFNEARRRYEAYRRGDMPSIPGDEAMARARNRLK